MDESGELLLKTVISAVLAFIAGAGVGYINYLLTSALTAKHPRAAAAVMPLRTLRITRQARSSLFIIRSMKKSGDGGKEDA